MPPQLPSDALPDMNGRQLDGGALKLEELVGTGSMGKVYRAVGAGWYSQGFVRGMECQEVVAHRRRQGFPQDGPGIGAEPLPQPPPRSLSLGTTDPPIQEAYYAVKCLVKPRSGSYQSRTLARELAIHDVLSNHRNVVTLYRVFAEALRDDDDDDSELRTRSSSYRQSYVFVVLSLAKMDLFQLITEENLVPPGCAGDIHGLSSTTSWLSSTSAVKTTQTITTPMDLKELQRDSPQLQVYLDIAIKDVFLQLVDAVEWCHAKGIAHRDIKPDNVLCTWDLGADSQGHFGHDGSVAGKFKILVMLADFGLATTQRLDDVDCGSLPYMSPEALACKTTILRTTYSTTHSDLWSLGILLLNLITAHNAWDSASPSHDPCFAYFLHDRFFKKGKWLRKTLGISKAADRVVQGLLEPNALCRMGLGRVRREVKGVETFFRGREKELEKKASSRKEEMQVQARLLSRLGKDATLGYVGSKNHAHSIPLVDVAKYMSLF